MPSNIGQALSIVGALVVGQAAVGCEADCLSDDYSRCNNGDYQPPEP